MDKLKVMLEQANWNSFEQRILALAVEGGKAFPSRSLPGKDNKVFQISIWTDAFARSSAINFETMGHATVADQIAAKWLSERGFHEDAETVLSSGRTFNPADFL